jgi:hypothetical protein
MHFLLSLRHTDEVHQSMTTSNLDLELGAIHLTSRMVINKGNLCNLNQMPELERSHKLQSLRWPTMHLLCQIHTHLKAIQTMVMLLRMASTMVNSLDEVLHRHKNSISRPHKINCHHEMLR